MLGGHGQVAAAGDGGAGDCRALSSMGLDAAKAPAASQVTLASRRLDGTPSFYGHPDALIRKGDRGGSWSSVDLGDVAQSEAGGYDGTHVSVGGSGCLASGWAKSAWSSTAGEAAPRPKAIPAISSRPVAGAQLRGLLSLSAVLGTSIGRARSRCRAHRGPP